MRGNIRLVIHHSVWKVYGISSHQEIEYYANRRDFVPDFHIQCMASRMDFHIQERVMPSFSAIDCTPEFINRKIMQIEDLAIFKTVNASQDIIVDPNDVAALLEHIHKIQSPIQKEIREKKRREVICRGMSLDGIKPEEKMHAQIITLVA